MAESNNYIKKTKNKSCKSKSTYSFWRRWRDLNSRAGFPTYALSRGASSPLEYISIW